MTTHQNEKFALVLGCMDGRCQAKASEYARNLFGAVHIDTVTEPGIDGILGGAAHPVFTSEELGLVRSLIEKKATVSAKGHGATQCLILGHNSCAGNPVEHEEHIFHLKNARNEVASWGLFNEIQLAVFDRNWNIAPIN